jgi:hypothetical protein
MRTWAEFNWLREESSGVYRDHNKEHSGSGTQQHSVTCRVCKHSRYHKQRIKTDADYKAYNCIEKKYYGRILMHIKSF